MYKVQEPLPTEITTNSEVVGETIEAKVRRIVNNNEPITDGAPLIYTDRKDGVQAEYDIRTDRFEIAVEAMDKVQKAQIAKRESYMKIVKDEPTTEGKTDTGGESIPATGTP
ncbi:MAG: hypothetical protein [Microvirus sp.]|nr:MAG: hypothetical protein [Microvirus sp.]